jgi:hypothetical protein
MSRFYRGVVVAGVMLGFGLAGCAPFDRAAGTDTSGKYPAQASRPTPPKPGDPVQRAYDRAAGTDTSGAYPQNQVH